MMMMMMCAWQGQQEPHLLLALTKFFIAFGQHVAFDIHVRAVLMWLMFEVCLMCAGMLQWCFSVLLLMRFCFVPSICFNPGFAEHVL